jgi:acetyl esterase/lipase
VAVATRRVHELGFDPGPIAVLGHSSGAHLAALAVLAYDDYPSSCEAPPVEPDALIGLSGPYDISRMPDIAAPLFGTAISEDPDTWASANPVARAALRPDVPVVLLHGEDDTNVPVDFTTDFGDALEAAGHPTTVTVVPGVDHFGIFRPEVAGDPVAEWLLGLP